MKKGDGSNPNNYLDIYQSSLYSLRRTSKCLVADAVLLEEQQGFGKGRTTTDHILSLNQAIEKLSELESETHLAFIDLKKHFDRVSRDKL